MDIFEKLRQSLPELTKKERDVAEVLLGDPHNGSFMTIRELANVSSVSPATVLRLAKSLGFAKYKDMCLAFHESAAIATPGMKKLREGQISHSFYSDLFFEHIISNETENISVVFTAFLKDNFRKAIEIIRSAENVRIFGARSSYSLAYYFGFLLQQFMKNVSYNSPNADNIYQEITTMGKNDVAIVFSFPHYTRSTVKVCKVLFERRVKIIGITDGPSSPLIKFTKLPLFCPNLSPFYSYTAAMTVCNMLILGLRESLGEVFQERFEIVSNTLIDEGVYY